MRRLSRKRPGAFGALGPRGDPRNDSSRVQDRPLGTGHRSRIRRLLETPTIKVPDPNRTLAEASVNIRHIHDVDGRSWNYVELEVGPVSGATKYQAQVMFVDRWGTDDRRFNISWTEDWAEGLKYVARVMRRTSTGVVEGNSKTVPGITHYRFSRKGTLSLRARALVNGEWSLWNTYSLVLK